MSMRVVIRAVVAAATLGVAAAGTVGSGVPVVMGIALGAGVLALAFAAEAVVARRRFEQAVWGVGGAVAGVVGGAVLGLSLAGVAGRAAPALSAVLALAGAYLGAAVGMRGGTEMRRPGASRPARDTTGLTLKVVDTSAIIDGRLADLAATGFLEGPLLVPQFVLRELQRVADATDPRKRTRGKRGFDVLQRLQALPDVRVTVEEVDAPEVRAVDEKLVLVAKARSAKILTTDHALNRLAAVSGVAVLNVNDLANALKPAMVAGDAMHVEVVREGKEAGQGIAYLDDGTMVVVDQGKRFIGQDVDVVVTSVLQTPAGRIVFTRKREAEPARA